MNIIAIQSYFKHYSYPRVNNQPEDRKSVTKTVWRFLWKASASVTTRGKVLQRTALHGVLELQMEHVMQKTN